MALSARSKQALRDRFDNPATPRNDMMRLYQAIHENFDAIQQPINRAHGTAVSFLVDWLEVEEPAACADLLVQFGGNARNQNLFAAFQRNASSANVIYKHCFRINRSWKNLWRHCRWTELDSNGNRRDGEEQVAVLPIKPKANPPSLALQNLLAVSPRTLPNNIAPTFVLCGYMEQKRVNTVNSVSAMRKLRGIFNNMEFASGLLLARVFNVPQVNWQSRVVLIRDEGITSANGTAGFAQWMRNLNLNSFLTYVSPDYAPVLAGLTRFDNYFPTMQRVPANEHLVLFFSEPTLVFQNARTLAAIAFTYLRRTGSTGTNVEFGFGLLGETAATHSYEMNSTLVDQYSYWRFDEASLMWEHYRDASWPLSRRRLRTAPLNFTAERANVIYHLSKMLGSRAPSFSMGFISRSSSFPGLNI